MESKSEILTIGPEDLLGQAAESARPSAWVKVLSGLVFLYAIVITALWLWMIRDGDRTPLATVFLFGPRWLCAVPLPLLAGAALLWRRWLLAPLAATALLIVGPIMGFQVNLPRSATGGARLRVLTCNVDEKRFRIESLAELIADQQPDVVALQEVRQRTPYIWPADWHVIEQDEFILASRWPLMKLEHCTRAAGHHELASIRYSVALPDGDVQVFNVHLTSPRLGLEAVLSPETLIDTSQSGRLDEILQLRALESKRTSDWVASFPGPKIVLGDFNAPAESQIFRDTWSWLGDAFGATGWGFGFTKISEAFGISYGSRIDHVLANPNWQPRRCWVGPDIGSDHLPLLAEFE